MTMTTTMAMAGRRRPKSAAAKTRRPSGSEGGCQQEAGVRFELRLLSCGAGALTVGSAVLLNGARENILAVVALRRGLRRLYRGCGLALLARRFEGQLHGR
jgi:hypothetical protein